MTRASLLALALLCGLPAPARAAGDHELVRLLELPEPVHGFMSLAEPELATLPAVGFFPMGGDAPAAGPLLGTTAIGAGVDLLNFHGEHARLSLLGGSAYLLGLNWTQLLAAGDTRFVDLAYLRVGPTLRLAHVPVVGALSVQVGLAALLSGSPATRTTGLQHGLDLSVSVPLWSGYDFEAARRRHQAERVREKANAATRWVEDRARKLAELDAQAEALRLEQARLRAELAQAQQARQQLRREYEGLNRP